jgi:ankyrin repeat protein
MLRFFVENGCDAFVNEFNSKSILTRYDGRKTFEENALMCAARMGKVEILRFLIEKGADVNASNSDGMTALVAANEERELTCTKVLLENGANGIKEVEVGLTLIHEVIVQNDLDLLRFFVENGCDTFINEFKSTYVNEGYFQGKQIDENSLMCAARLNRYDFLEFLLEKGADIKGVNGDGMTVIIAAAGGLETDEYSLRLLLDKGADHTKSMNDGVSALIAAASLGKTGKGSVQILLEEGADVNTSDGAGMTPLLSAIECPRYGSRSVELVRLLIENGADVNASDNDGRSPLFMIASCCPGLIEDEHVEYGRLLIENCANVNASDKNGMTVLEAAWGHLYDEYIKEGYKSMRDKYDFGGALGGQRRWMHFLECLMSKSDGISLGNGWQRLDLKMFESCCGGARSENNGTKKVISTTTEIDETTDGISLGNGWQRWVDFEERRYYYSKGGTTTWEAPSEEDLIEEENKTKGKK